MIILALDLALTGPTGWVLWDTKKDDPILDYGTFRPKVKDGQEIYAGVEIYHWLIKAIGREDIFIHFVAYEITDWHRTLTGKGKNFAVEYAMERQAQRTLGRAETAVVIAATTMGKTPYAIGANEAKKEFGALRKDACARLFSRQWERFEFIEEAEENAKEFLTDKLTGIRIPHHVSDAFVIAQVVANRLTQKELVRDADA